MQFPTQTINAVLSPHQFSFCLLKQACCIVDLGQQNLGGRRRIFVQLKKESKTEREEKRKWVVKKGVEKKSPLNAAEIAEALVKLLYLGILKNIEINGEIGCLLSEK